MFWLLFSLLILITFYVIVAPIRRRELKAHGFLSWVISTPNRPRRPLLVNDWLPPFGAIFVPGILSIVCLVGGVSSLVRSTDLSTGEAVMFMVSGVGGILMLAMYVRRPPNDRK